MAVMRVNPTRMELTKLKKKLQIARRGYKLLKDKQDELMRIFLELIRKTKDLRVSVEQKIEEANRHFIIARSVMKSETIKSALMISRENVRVKVETKNLMGIEIPMFKNDPTVSSQINAHPYGYAFTSGDLDISIKMLSDVSEGMLELAQKEKSSMLLAAEIEKTRRRVNALEHVMIPDLVDTIKFITMKLDENERSNITRLMKIKDRIVLENKYSK